ncbi:MAG: fumarylacetoacetate hydrolase family protein, partial [Pseudomonadales bacterium]|nr:fumarylacetoacetate hydrolase family protein [Pseudomonadales bacterium]
MKYSHRFVEGETLSLATGKVVCVGRNYAEHAKELNNPVPTSPLLFIKPSTSLVSMDEPIELPVSGEPCHFETEISVLIGDVISKQTPENIQDKIAGYGLGLDLTLRELQNKLKSKGHPWEISKAFDGSCPL